MRVVVVVPVPADVAHVIGVHVDDDGAVLVLDMVHVVDVVLAIERSENGKQTDDDCRLLLGCPTLADRNEKR